MVFWYPLGMPHQLLVLLLQQLNLCLHLLEDLCCLRLQCVKLLYHLLKALSCFLPVFVDNIQDLVQGGHNLQMSLQGVIVFLLRGCQWLNCLHPSILL